jgi:Icc-related predicted phosphoesterase
MNILCFSDLHLDGAAARRLAARALVGNLDLVVSAGDLGLDGVHDREIYEVLAKSGVPVLAVPGNHDGDDAYERMTELVGWKSIDRVIHDCGEYVFAGYGIRANPDDMAQEEARFRAFADLVEDVPPERLVLVTHLPPSGTLAARDRRLIDRGSAALAEWVLRRQPTAVICGHVHHREPVTERLGATLVVNPGPFGLSLRLPS